MLSYRDAMRAIFQRSDYEREGQPLYGERVWRLSRMEELLGQLGNPHRTFPSVHIAGTKGKGSTTAMVESILRTAGYRTGMYTSPHLHTFRERIRFDGQPISEQDLIALVERIVPLIDARPEVTVFEVITALAMLGFAEAGVDMGVFEVGMGGRLDATNVLQPLVSVITSLSLDHTNVLGNTLAAIAGEKAGIVKAGIPVVSAPQRPEAGEVIAQRCAALGAPLTVAGSDWCWQPLGGGASRQRLAVFSRGRQANPEYPDLEIPLLGAHQMENACVAVAAIENLRAQGVTIAREDVRAGLAQVEWPGRMEVLGKHPLVLVDGAHNPYSIQKLLEGVEAVAPGARLWVIFGASMNHTPSALVAQFVPLAHKLYVTQAHHPKATPAAELEAAVRHLGGAAELAPSVAKGLAVAVEDAGPDDVVLVTGSLFVVAEARTAWAAMRGLPPLPSDPPGVY
ncbi:MAG: bifunctional folylpolyglutamate synthase/dihydrofolate synthase [Anaerolineae bacterium]